MAGANAAAIKARIVQHMNADHSDSLEDYLRFYNNVTPMPQSAKLVKFDVDYMEIEYTTESGSKRTSIVKINPPMSDLSKSRVTLVAMAEEATRQSLHEPSATLPEQDSATASQQIGWTPPDWRGFLSLSLLCFGFWALYYSYPLSADGPLIRILPSAIVLFGRTFREQLFALMIGMHLIEGMVVARKCVEQKMSTRLLVLWTIDGLSEGIPAIIRLHECIAKHAEGS